MRTLPKICMVIGRYRPRTGGTEIQAERLAHALKDQNIYVSIITGRDSGLSAWQADEGIQIQRLWIPLQRRSPLNALAFGANLYYTLLRQHKKFDIIHIHQAFYPAFFATAAARRLKKPTLIKIANSDTHFDLRVLSKQIPLFSKWMAKYIAKHTTYFVTLNPQITKQLNDWDISEQKIVSIPNGIVPPPVLSLSEKMIFRNVLGLSKEEICLLNVGSLQAKKNQRILLELATQLRLEGLPFKFYILGEGPLRNELETVIKTHQLEKNVYLVGKVNNVNSYLQAADMFVLPSYTEGMSNALLEAMSYSIPCIVSDIPANCTLIQHDHNGLIFDVQNESQLLERVKQVLSHREYASVLGDNARETIQAEYAMPKITEKYISLYKKLVAQN